MKTQGDALKLTNWNWDTKLAATSFSVNLQGAVKHRHGLNRNHQIQIVGDFNKRRKSMRKTEKLKVFFGKSQLGRLSRAGGLRTDVQD